MTSDLNVPLTQEAFESLREVSKHGMQRIIPSEHKDHLIRAGYVRQALGGLMLTDIGQLRLAVGH